MPYGEVVGSLQPAAYGAGRQRDLGWLRTALGVTAEPVLLHTSAWWKWGTCLVFLPLCNASLLWKGYSHWSPGCAGGRHERGTFPALSLQHLVPTNMGSTRVAVCKTVNSLDLIDDIHVRTRSSRGAEVETELPIEAR